MEDVVYEQEAIAYLQVLQKRLVEKFQKDFFEKTGKHVDCVVRGNSPAYSDKNHIRLSLEELYACTVAAFPGIDIKHKSRKREYVAVRHAFMLIAAEHEKYVLSVIGEFLGGRDHTTVIHGRDTALNHIDTKDVAFMDTYNELFDYIKNYYDSKHHPTAPIKLDTESVVSANLC